MAAEVETWLDVIPALAFARFVPYVRRDRERRTHVGGSVSPDGSTALDANENVISTNGVRPDRNYVVDLDEAQGFAYALRQGGPGLQRQVHRNALLNHRKTAVHGWDPLVRRHIDGRTTDADCLALAKALAEVMS